VYVTGLLEGVGSFTYSRGRQQLTLVFAMRMPGNNRPLLESIQRFFGNAGRVYQRADGGSCVYRITRPNELMRLIGHLDRHPLVGDKRRLYEIWRELVMERVAHQGSRPTPEQLGQLAELTAARDQKMS
jgi:hypothetical protein